ncbi:hypothetical protein ACVXZ0_01310 [Staphylococcus aureus]
MIFVYALLALVITFVFGTCFNTYIKKDEIWSKYSRRRSTKRYEEDWYTNNGWTNISIKYCDNVFGGYYICHQANPIILLLFVTIGFGLIGFIDDYIIVVKKNNQGLTSKQKFLAQIGIAIIFFVLVMCFIW